MLILSRRIGESIVLQCPDGTTILVVLNDIDGSKVRIGIDAPREVKIHRAELLERTPKEKTP